jgi:type II secretion system protein N
MGFNPFGFLAGLLQISFDARPAEKGKIEGKAGMPILGTSQKAYFEIKLSEVDLESLAWLSSLSGRDLKGKANGEMKFKGDFSNLGTVLGEGRFLLKNGFVETRMDLAGLKAIPFDSVRIPFVVKENRVLMDKGEMEGPMLSGTLTGWISLNKKITDSGLDLTARMMPGPLLEKNPLSEAFLSKTRKGGKEIILKIEGSVRQPTINWGKS